MIATQGSKNPKMNKNFFGEVPFFLKTCLLEAVRAINIKTDKKDAKKFNIDMLCLALSKQRLTNIQYLKTLHYILLFL